MVCGTNDWPLSCNHAEAGRCVQDKMGGCLVRQRKRAGKKLEVIHTSFLNAPTLSVVSIVVCAGQK